MNSSEKIIDINLIELISFLLKRWRQALIFVGVFTLLGVVMALIWPVQYEASIKILPEQEEDGTNNLLDRFGGLAGLSSFNFSSNSTFSPDLYQDIIYSKKFMLELISEELIYSGDSSVKYETLAPELSNPLTFIKKYTVGLIGLIKSSLFGDFEVKETSTSSTTYQLSKEQLSSIESLSKRVEIEIDDIKGIVIIRGKMPTRLMAADLVKKVYEKLTGQITTYKLTKTEQTIAYLEEQYKVTYEEYLLRQSDLESFYSSNINILSPGLRFSQENLEYEYQKSRELFNGVHSQLLQMRLELQKETPAFTIINPIIIPLEKSEPKRLIIILISLILGFFFYLMYLYLEYLIKTFKNEFKRK